MAESDNSSNYEFSSAGEGSDGEQVDCHFSHDMVEFRAKVLHHHNAEYEDELNLRVGDEVDVLSTDPKYSGNYSWWTGRTMTGVVGVFPATCVRPLASPSTPRRMQSSPTPTSFRRIVHTSTTPPALQTVVSIPGNPQPSLDFPPRISARDLELKEIVGIGGFGNVHRALWHNHEVAVKVSRFSEDQFAAVEDVMKEARRFAFLNHKNICSLVGVCLDYPQISIVMPFAQGGSLSKTVHNQTIQLPVCVALDWAIQIADGMQYLHHGINKPLIHRDLKSNNSKWYTLLSNPCTYSSKPYFIILCFDDASRP